MIFFDHTDLSSAGQAKKDLQVQIEASLSGVPDNPISDGMRLAELQAGNVEEQTLAVVLDRLQRLGHTTDVIDRRLAEAERREEIKSNIRRRPQEALRTGLGFKIPTDEEKLREYPPPVQIEIPGDLTDEEKAEILTEAERRINPLSDPHGDPEAG